MPPSRSHIAMIGIPIVSHVLPGLGIVRELVARGHRVTYANDPAVADRIEATGAELVPCASVLPVADPETARRSARLRAAARSEGGTPRAVGLIEDMVPPRGVTDR